MRGECISIPALRKKSEIVKVSNGFHAFVFGPSMENENVRVFSLLLSNSIEVAKNKLTKAKKPPITYSAKIQKCNNRLTVCAFKRSGRMCFVLCFFGEKSYYSNYYWNGKKWDSFSRWTQRVYKDVSTFTDTLTDNEFNNWKRLFLGSIESRKVALTMAYEVGERIRL